LRQISEATGVNKTVVGDYVRRAGVIGITWPVSEEIDDAGLERRLFPIPCETGPPRAAIDWRKIHEEMKRRSVTLVLLWQEYRAEQADGYGYSHFCDLYGEWRKTILATMRQTHPAGEKLFVDYAGDTVLVFDQVTGAQRPAHIFVAVLGASNYTYAEARWSEGLADWIAAHVNVLAVIGGVPKAVVCDNLKAGVIKPSRYEPGINRTYQDLAEHYGFAVLPARVRKPRDKAKVEVAVLIVQRFVLARLRNRRFFSLVELNVAIRECVSDLNAKIMRKIGKSRAELLETIDRPALDALPAEPYRYAEWKNCLVAPDYHVEIDKHYYSVPSRLIRATVEARITDTTVEILHKGNRIASHARSGVPHRHTMITEHMPSAHRRYAEWTPMRMMRQAEKIGPSTVALVEATMKAKPHPEQGFRACLGIMRLEKSYGAQRLEAACRRGNDIGATSYGSVASIPRHGLDKAYAQENARRASRSGTPTSAGAATTTERRRHAHPFHPRSPARAHRNGQGAGGSAATTRHRCARAFEERIAMMIDREAVERENKRLTIRLKFACLRQSAVAEDVDMKAPRGLDKSLFQKLVAGDWIDRHQNLIVIGPTGVGKSWLACALGHKACRDDRSVLYQRVPRLFDALALARRDGRHARMLKSLARVELLILDDWGLGTLTQEQGRDLLEIVDDRHNRASTIVTSQLPVDHWHEAIANSTVADAILDRLVHSAHRLTLNGDSMRKAAAKRSGLDASPAP
jgi:transposase/DNA replication protein DnaC